MKNLNNYLTRKNAKIPKSNFEIWEIGEDIPLNDVLKIENKNELLNDGYLDSENEKEFTTKRIGKTYVLPLHTRI